MRITPLKKIFPVPLSTNCPRISHSYCQGMRKKTGVFLKALPLALFVPGCLWARAEGLWQEYRNEIQPLLSEYCYDCHGEGAKKGGVSLDGAKDLNTLLQKRDSWEGAWENLHRRNMPPADKPQPTDKEIDRVLTWVEKAVFDHDPRNRDPGRVVLRRLNRVEYRNTVRDLFGVDFDAEAFFPADDTGHGFDTIGEVLTLSPLLLEKYLGAADTILEDAFGLAGSKQTTNVFEASSIRGGRMLNRSRVLPSHGSFSVLTATGTPGNYLVEIDASASRAGKSLARMGVRVGKVFSRELEVRAEYPEFKTYRLEVRLGKTPELAIQASFLNDFYDPRNKDPRMRDRNLFLRRISITPLDAAKPPSLERRKKLLGWERGKDYSLEIIRPRLERLLSRIYRFPLDDSELDRHLAFLKASRKGDEDNLGALMVVLKAALVSPKFLYREELPPEEGKPTESYPLDDFALASRLSYFLWSSLPDEALWQKANAGKLRTSLGEEVRRMVADRKSEAFARNFIGQWLQLRDLDLSNPDRRRFPSFTDELKDSMRRETETFFSFVLRQNRPITELLTAEYTFSNQTLASFYGLEGKFGKNFDKVSLNGPAGVRRGGLLAHSSILTITSNPTRTSPVKRGRWVLDNLLGAPPKDPPPGIAELETVDEEGKPSMTLREQLAKHSRKSECSSCHANMDALGFALENFDAIGKWRTHERGSEIDSRGKLATGETFSGSRELQKFIAERKIAAFARCLTEKLMTYGIGRGMEYYDRAAIEGIARKSVLEGDGLLDLLTGVVQSRPFTHSKGQTLNSPDQK